MPQGDLYIAQTLRLGVPGVDIFYPLNSVAIENKLPAASVSMEAFDTARAQVQIFRDELLNQADESRSIALAAYEEGATPLLSVLEAQRTRTEVREHPGMVC